jgi:helicase MOV-10
VCGDPAVISLACNWEGLPKRGFPLIFHGVKGKDQREENSPRYRSTCFEVRLPLPFIFNFLLYVHLETLCFTCSYFNNQEIEVVRHYVKLLLADHFSGRKLRQEDIGIITPYRKQVRFFLFSVKLYLLQT